MTAETPDHLVLAPTMLEIELGNRRQQTQLAYKNLSFGSSIGPNKATSQRTLHIRNSRVGGTTVKTEGLSGDSSNGGIINLVHTGSGKPI